MGFLLRFKNCRRLLIVRIKIFVLLNILLLAGLTFSQEKNVLEDSSHTQISLPRFDVHLGAGWVNGARIGTRLLITKYFSTEVAYGYNITNFLSLSDEEKKYSLAVNYHPYIHSKLIISFIFTYGEKVYLLNRSINFSLNVGFLELKRKNISPFIRSGIYFQVGEKYYKKGFYKKEIGFNLDIGINWNFP